MFRPSDTEENLVKFDSLGEEASSTSYPCTPPVIIGSVPRCIPKLQGARIQTGLLNQEEVIKSLRSYHKLAGQWVEAILKHKAVIQDHDIKKLERKTWPNYIIDKFTYLDTGMVASSFEEDNSVPMRAIKNCIKLINSVSNSWLPMVEVKESYPVQLAEYAKLHHLEEEPAFIWWVAHALRK